MKGLYKKSRMVALSIATLSLLCSVTIQPARAGWQVLRYEYDGTNKLHYDNYPQPPSDALNSTEHWSDIGSTGGGTSRDYPTGTGGWGQSSGKVRTVYKWVRRSIGGSGSGGSGGSSGSGGTPDPNDNPPAVLYLKITMSASAAAASDTREGAPDRMPGKEHVDATAMGKTGEVIDANNLKSSSVGVVRLVQVQTGGGAEVAGPWCNANARAEVETDRYVTNPLPPESDGPPSQTPIPGMFGAAVNYGSAIDTRGVTISRDGAINETVDDDGTVHGDTTFSYRTASGGVVENVQFFHSTQIGFPPATSSWQWNPAGRTTITGGDTIDTSWQPISFGSLNHDVAENWAGTPTPGQPHPVTYTVTDSSDGASATATYKLTVHDEVEKVAKTSDGIVSVQGPLWGSDPTQGGDGLLVVRGFTRKGDKSVSSGHGTSSGWTFVGGSEPGLSFAKIRIPLGVSVEYNSSGSSEITTTSSLPFDVPLGKYTYPMFEHSYNRYRTTFRHFTSPGEHRLALPPNVQGPPPYHMAVWDEYVGGDIRWHPLIHESIPAPVRDPQAPPPITPDP